MHCYLHIGTEKTGTTLIQDFLHLNAEKLESLGFGYLRSAGYPNNMWAVVAAYDVDRRDRWTANKKVNTDADLLHLQSIITNGMREELASKKIKALVVSSEHIQSRLTNYSELARLKDILEHLGVTSFSVILYIRDPAQAAASLYSTSIKSGSKKESPHFPQAANYNRICNHKFTIELFSSVFGEERLEVRLFEKDFLLNRSVLDDFLSLLRLSNSSEFNQPKNENKALSTLGLELLRRINEHIPNLDERPRLALRREILSYWDKYFSDEKYILSNDLYLAYEQEFQESNEWVRSKFFPERSRLFRLRKRPNLDTSELNSTQLDKLANLLSDIWLERERDLLQQASLNDQKA
ncbi:MAG: hypothetical protein WBP46_01455 [Thiolinea sp.]